MSGNNWGSFLKKRTIQTNIAPELIRRGWNLFDYREPTHEEETFMSHDCQWTGVAIHPDVPDTILCVWVSDYDVRGSSGKSVYDLSGLPTLPENAVLPFNLPQFPEFQANPKGFGWHIEKGGVVLHKGKFHKDCAMYAETYARPQIEAIVDKIERLALGRTIIEAVPVPVKLAAPEPDMSATLTAHATPCTFAIRRALTPSGLRFQLARRGALKPCARAAFCHATAILAAGVPDGTTRGNQAAESARLKSKKPQPEQMSLMSAIQRSAPPGKRGSEEVRAGG